MSILGIDLGTTNSLCAVWKDGKSQLIPNRLSDFLTPSVVSIDEDGTLLVGKVAKERLVSHPEATASLFKRYMGTGRQFTLNDKKYRPEELSALVIRQLKEDAELFLGEEITEAVISVPAYYNDRQRFATKQAGALAGLYVERLVNEPSAAALVSHYTNSEKDDYRKYIVFDMGGGTLDVSVVECFDNIVNILAISGDNHLGGSDFDYELARYFCRQNEIEYDTLSDTAKASLLRQAELCKFELSKKNSTEMTVENEGISGSVIVGNQKLIEICNRLLLRIERTVRRVMVDSQTALHDISNIILVGGSCHMPVIKQYLQHVLGVSQIKNVSPDLCVVMGLGIYTGIKERNIDIKDVLLTDICPFSLGINVHNSSNPARPLMSVLIERNSTLPTSKVHEFCTAVDFQTRIHVGVYQGEAMYVEDNLNLIDINMSVPKKPAGEEKISVRFTYDINGILEVEVKACSTQQMERRIVVSKDNALTEEEVKERMQELAALKVHPRDEEENRHLLARAERLYKETTGSVRDILMENHTRFSYILEQQDRPRIRRARKIFSAFLDSVDDGHQGIHTVSFDFSGDDFS